MLKKSSMKSLQMGRSIRRRKFILGVILSSILVLSPFLFYFYRYAPANATTWDIYFFTIHSGGFSSVHNFAHAFLTKFLVLIFLSAWYLTCRDWWKYAIMVPFTMTAFQLSGVINYQNKFIDEYDFWYSLPVVLPLVGLLFFIGRKLEYLTTAIDLKEELEQEIAKLKKNLKV